MPYNDKQRQWIDQLIDTDADSWAQEETQRSEALSSIHQEVDAIRDWLTAGFHQTLTERRPLIQIGGFTLGEQVQEHRTVRPDRDVLQEVDMRDDNEMARVDALPIASHGALIQAQDEIDHLAEQMRTATNESGERLFSDEDIMHELYSPLVSSRIMSELQVPKQYSQYEQTFESAAALYNQRIQELAKPRGFEERTKEHIQTSIEYINLTKDLAMPFAKICGPAQANALAQSAALLATAAKGVEVALLDTKPWVKGTTLAIDLVCDTITLFRGEIGKKLKSSIKGSAKFVSATSHFSAGRIQAACTDVGAAIKEGSNIFDTGQTRAASLAVASLFSSADAYEDIQQAYHDDRPDRIVARLRQIGIDARKIYLENLKHPKPKKEGEKLTKEQLAHNKALDQQIKDTDKLVEVMAAPQVVKNAFVSLSEAWTAGKPKAVMKVLVEDMGLPMARRTLMGLKVDVPERGGPLTEQQQQQQDSADAWNQQLDDLLKMADDAERVVKMTDEIDTVAAGWAAYRQTDDHSALVATLQKFGQEAFSAYVTSQKHSKPARGELTQQQQQENKDLDKLLLKYTGISTILQGGVQMRTGTQGATSGPIVKGGEQAMLGGLKLAQASGAKNKNSQTAVSLASSSLQTMLAVSEANGSDATSAFTSVLKNADKAKIALLDQLKDKENQKAIEAIKKHELVEAGLKKSIQKSLDISLPTAELLELKERQLEQMEAEGLRARVEADRASFRAELELCIGGIDPDQDPRTRHAMAAAYDIDTLIAKLERDKIVLDAALQLAGGLSLGTGFIPGVETITAIKGLMVSVAEAMSRRAEYHRFLDSMETAEVSMSPYAPAIRKRLEDSLNVYSEAQCKSITNLCHVFGSILGPVTGAIEQAIVTLSGADKRRATYTEQEKQEAWTIYQAALKDSSNRKLRIRALQVNPTLGKYALAYGAETGDPVARKFMKCCGLNEQTLASPKTNVDKVVQYLGLYFSEEIVTGDIELPQQWAQGHHVALSTTSWLEVTKKAVRSASLKAGGDEQVVRILLELQSHPYHSSPSPLQNHIESFIATLKRFQWAVDAYAPIDSRSQPHTDMIEIAARYRSLASREQGLAEVALGNR